MATIKELRYELGDTLKQMRGLLDHAESQKRSMTDAENKEYKHLDMKVDEIKENIKKKERIEEIEAAGKRIVNPYPGEILGNRGQRNLDDGGFQGLGEFCHAVWQFRKEGIRDDRLEALRPEARGQSMGGGTEGGFAIPEQFRPELLMAPTQTGIVRPRATVIPAGDPPDAKISIPSLDQTSAQNNFGGVTMTHTGEALTLTETDANLRQVILEPKKIAGYVIASNELLNNWTASSAVLGGLMRKAMAAQEDYDFLRGDGVNKSLGFINSPAAIGFNRAGAGTIAWSDTYNMLSKLKMGGSPVWLASQTTVPALAAMVDSGGNSVFTGSKAAGLEGAQGAFPATLWGFPLYFVDRLPTLGNKGDLNLVDLSYYLIKDGSGAYLDISKELYFLTDRSVFRLTWRVDGKPWLSEPLTLEGNSSSTVSPFVVLDTP